MKLTEARIRALGYMIATGCNLVRFGGSTGWTSDAFQWPISTLTFDALIDIGAIEPAAHQASNQTISYSITEAGRLALSSGSERS